MRISTRELNGRKVWNLDNGALTLAIQEGGGNIVNLGFNAGPKVNPFWVPVWRTMEPWQFKRAMAPKYGNTKLLACISGHNLCLSAFGEPSPEEIKAGFENHGEATVSRWKTIGRKAGGRTLMFVQSCELPLARMKVARTVASVQGSNIFRVTEKVTNLARQDVPFTMCEHVTFGPPFLEKGVTVFDMSATRGHTMPSVFGTIQRLRVNQPFVWPAGPGVKGKVDLRMIGKEYRKSSDFSTQLMDPRKDTAWFSAVNPRQGLLVAYVWDRSDFPWVGNWEENYGRQSVPWNGKSLTRGMEFANTPWPIGLRRAVSLHRFQGQPTYRWLPARTTVAVRYSIIALRVNSRCKGVESIAPEGNKFAIDLKV